MAFLIESKIFVVVIILFDFSITSFGRTTEDSPKTDNQNAASLNILSTGLGEKGKKYSWYKVGQLAPAPKVLMEKALSDNTLDYDEDEPDYEIDEGVFTSIGDMGKALRQVWDSFSKRMDGIERKVQRVEQQTLAILNRMAIVDCSALPDGTPTGIYTLYLDNQGTHSVRALCEMEAEGGGWTVILQRVPHEVVERATNFSRGLRDYKVGFGEPDGDYWIGLENIRKWTSSRDYQLRIQLEDFNGDTAFAHYDRFYLEDESNGYRLHVSGYRGNAGDSLSNLNNLDNYTAEGMMFSTHDDDRDTSHEINCAHYWNIGGWWFNRCSWANLMGPYKLPGQGDGIGINWHKWRNKQYLKSVLMMIRPPTT
ncbi:techylectin-5A [Hyalella azteca]|uniref:Techylectin-5A n=2 Tax=Hyalella azteca TaxID=294128 RepID=A0A8B7NNR8_HYAAZ|nr:techylectin-5A [Hyalella azteca]